MAIMSGRRGLEGSMVALLCAFQAAASLGITVLTALQKQALPPPSPPPRAPAPFPLFVTLVFTSKYL